MLDGLRRRLSYANVMATIAVFGVLAGGGAYAASKIGPKDIKKNAVRAKHIKERQVKARHLAKNAVPIRRVAFRPSGNPTAERTILNLGGLRLRATCTMGGTPIVEASTSVPDGRLDSISVDAIGGDTTRNDVSDADFDPGDDHNLIAEDTVNMVGSTRYAGGDGRIVIVEWHAYGQPGCDHFVGYATG